MCDVALELKRRYGCHITMFARKSDSIEFFRERNKDNRFDTIVDAGHLTLKHARSAADLSIETARAVAWEQRIGTPFNTLAMGDRHLGRGYVLGGWNHPRSRQSEQSNYSDLLRFYSSNLDFWYREFEERNISLVLGGNKEVCCIARLLDIPFRNFAIARFGSKYNWVHDEYSSQPEIEFVYGRLKNKPVEPVTLGGSYLTAEMDKPAWLARSTVPNLLTNCVRRIATHAYWHLRGFEKAKGYYLGSELRYLYRLFRELRKMTRKRMPRLSDLGVQKFIFFPLATEPESTLTTFSPEYFFQHASITSLVRDMPADMFLVVKEAIYGVGRRPKEMLEQIAALKPVVVMDIRESGLEVIRRASVVATITGTAGFEAAVMGIPVITFWQRCPYAFLPLVRVVKTVSDVRDALAYFLSGEFNRERARQEGARYYRALEAVSVDMGSFYHRDRTAYSAETVSSACDRLVGIFAEQTEMAESAAARDADSRTAGAATPAP